MRRRSLNRSSRLLLVVALALGMLLLWGGSAWAAEPRGGDQVIIIGLTTLSPDMRLFAFVWPAMLIGGGLALLLRALRRTTPSREEDPYDNTALPQSH